MDSDLKPVVRQGRVRMAGSGSPPSGPTPSKAARMGMRAAILIEAAMLTCEETDIPELDCLLQARRALSPIVDKRKELLQTK